MFSNTVEYNKEKYTKRAYDRAMMAPKPQNKLEYPSTRTYLKVFEYNLLPKFPIAGEYIP